MMVNCYDCNSKVLAKNTWRTHCPECGNEIAICDECFDTFTGDERYQGVKIGKPNCCRRKRFYEMLSIKS